MIAEGVYDGTVLDGYCEETQKNELVVCIEVDLQGQEGEPVVCRHPAFGEYGHLAEAVVRHLGLEWPYGLESLATAKGKTVRVRCKHKTYKGDIDVRFYVVTSERKKADAATVSAYVARLSANAGSNDPDIPF
jgi:hypothetical protein